MARRRKKIQLIQAEEQAWVKQSDVLMDKRWMVRLRRVPLAYRAARFVINKVG